MRKWVAGLLLIALALWLGTEAAGRAPALAPAGLVGAAGVAVLVGRPWGRWLGLAVSGLELAFMLFVFSQANMGQGPEIAELFFADAEGHFSWIDVGLTSIAFALGFVVSAALLISPFSALGNQDAGSGARGDR